MEGAPRASLVNGLRALPRHATCGSTFFSICSIHATTAATQLVGPTGIPANYAQGMDFDRRSGQLYAWIYDELQGNTAFSRIDLDTGQAQVLVRVDGEFEGVITASPPRIFRDGFEPLPATH